MLFIFTLADIQEKRIRYWRSTIFDRHIHITQQDSKHLPERW